MYPDVWFAIVTLLWNTSRLNVETVKLTQRYYDAERLQQLFQEISVTYIFDYLHEIGLFHRI